MKNDRQMYSFNKLVCLIQNSLKIFIYSKFIIISSFHIKIAQFINKNRGLCCGGSVNHNYMCCLEYSMAFGFADKLKCNR